MVLWSIHQITKYRVSLVIAQNVDLQFFDRSSLPLEIENMTFHMREVVVTYKASKGYSVLMQKLIEIQKNHIKKCQNGEFFI